MNNMEEKNDWHLNEKILQEKIEDNRHQEGMAKLNDGAIGRFLGRCSELCFYSLCVIDCHSVCHNVVFK